MPLRGLSNLHHDLSADNPLLKGYSNLRVVLSMPHQYLALLSMHLHLSEVDSLNLSLHVVHVLIGLECQCNLPTPLFLYNGVQLLHPLSYSPRSWVELTNIDDRESKLVDDV